MKTIFKEKKEENKNRTHCEIYSRVVGYLRPINQWNKGKKQEFQDRKNFNNKNIEHGMIN